MAEPFSIVVLGGPNGAGKSTISREVLASTLGIVEFVNADVIATGLSGFDPDRAAFAAGRIMLERLRELALARQGFAFESTLASRTFAPWLAIQKKAGAVVRVVYVWLQSPDAAIARVHARFGRGGHFVPEETVRRRYYRSAANFWHLYRPLADEWQVYDNTTSQPVLVVHGISDVEQTVLRRAIFARFEETIRDAGQQRTAD